MCCALPPSLRAARAQEPQANLSPQALNLWSAMAAPFWRWLQPKLEPAQDVDTEERLLRLLAGVHQQLGAKHELMTSQ